MTNNGKSLEKLEILHKIYTRGGYSSEILERSLDKVIAYEITAAQRDAKELKERLQVFETRYKMSSDHFYKRFQIGEMGDDMDFVEWSVFYEMWMSLRERLEILESETS